MDEEQREIMSRLVNSRADRIIEAAHKGAFEPRGGIAALSGPMGRQRVVEALMVRHKTAAWTPAYVDKPVRMLSLPRLCRRHIHAL